MGSDDMPEGTGTREDVDPVEWAEQYDIGDTIHYRIPGNGIASGKLLGFSTTIANQGLPVIALTDQLEAAFRENDKTPAKTVAIPEEQHIDRDAPEVSDD